MEVKVGDSVSLDAKKVGQLRRTGVVRAVTKGMSGPRLEIEWEGGGVSIIAPGAGILLVGGKAKSKQKPKAKPKAKPKPKSKAKAAKPKSKAKAAKPKVKGPKKAKKAKKAKR